ncbi:hypothetical protein CEXT_9151 [Caerostris extrusa]|uniref:Uncharacterized protein n=1 Tax=Caerostris extrusa TaxID=172846 RepID=A0AAV4UY33_CAEEX|nr:hypothetical protein CEXT_9151 [Caerostris extrusa]
MEMLHNPFKRQTPHCFGNSFHLLSFRNNHQETETTLQDKTIIFLDVYLRIDQKQAGIVSPPQVYLPSMLGTKDRNNQRFPFY